LNHEHDAEDAFQATFLLLARKAGAIRWRESVGNWLYEAAYRIASKARVQGARRHRHEQQAATMQPLSSPAPAWDELRVVLDEELHRLPEKYRMPLLLCYLHGKTRDEAAEQLGWTVGTVKGCLERGRDILRGRLARRGLALSAALLPSMLGTEASATVPATLTAATLSAVTTGTVAAPVTVLLKGAVQAMFWARVRTAGQMLVVFVGLAAGAGTLTYRAWGEGKGAAHAMADMLSTEATGKVAHDGDADLFKEYQGTEKVPESLRKTFAAFAMGAREGKVDPFCLPSAVSISREARPNHPEQGRDINLPFLRNGFSPHVLTVRKEAEDCYLLRTGTSATRWVQTRAGDWKLYGYLDKPIE
jgi:RNA polymerase sigma factor (sigma-70 family)